MITNFTPLQQRLAVSGIGTLVALIMIFLAPVPVFIPFFAAFIAGIICIAMWELYQIYRAKGLEPAMKVGLTFGGLYTMAVAADTQYHAAAMLPELILLISLLSCFFYYFSIDGFGLTLYCIESEKYLKKFAFKFSAKVFHFIIYILKNMR